MSSQRAAGSAISARQRRRKATADSVMVARRLELVALRKANVGFEEGCVRR